MGLLEIIIIPTICVAIVYGIKDFFWKEKVPAIVEKLRWLIAIIAAIITIIFGSLFLSNRQITPFLAAGILVLIIIAFKNDKQKVEKKSEYTCPKCKHPISVNHKYCTNCGNNLSKQVI